MVTTRRNPLSLIAPDLATLSDALGTDSRRAAEVQAIRLAAIHAGLVDERFVRALDRAERGPCAECDELLDMQRLASEWDERAWDLQASGEEGKGSMAAYRLAFARARVASALTFALAGSSREQANESLYEAAVALDDPDRVRTLLRDARAPRAATDGA